MKVLRILLACLLPVFTIAQTEPVQWIRINQLGYLPNHSKVAVWVSQQETTIQQFSLVDAASGKMVFKGQAGRAFGAYGPFRQSYRLDFSAFRGQGRFRIKAGAAISPEFAINPSVYAGAPDFCLRYMRQQRSGFNPFLKDSCHQYDGYTLYGPMPDSTHVDVSGGWHDATDYLQYVTTSANATYHLLMAFRDYPKAFGDAHQANGLEGSNGRADVLDEAKWGLDWLLKMHPRPDWMFNQLADDRDHIDMRLPKLDGQYGRGFERPVYFVTGEPQQRGKFLNHTTGTSSTAGKFASAFALGAQLLQTFDTAYAHLLLNRSASAYLFALRKKGYTQTASVKQPYIYAEENWVDDMELALAAMHRLPALRNNDQVSEAIDYARQEPHTPWLGTDTASHYQWYPFINLGHYELAKQLKGEQRDLLIRYYREGIASVWNKAKTNAFYRGVPFIWCSNNLTTSFAIQCKWYRELSRDNQFAELEQANIDWLFGCNPWGTSMVYGLPAGGDTPVDPHSSFTHIGHYPIDGALVDGPVYTTIFNSLFGLTLHDADEYARFQSALAVYHDDYGDYSTNEPTMDGTAALIYLLAACASGN